MRCNDHCKHWGLKNWHVALTWFLLIWWLSNISKKTMIVSHWNVQNLWNPPFLLHNIICTCSDSSNTSTFFSEPEILKNPTLSSHGPLPSNPSGFLGFQKIRIGPSDQIWMPTLQGCRSGGFDSFHDDHDLPTCFNGEVFGGSFGGKFCFTMRSWHANLGVNNVFLMLKIIHFKKVLSHGDIYFRARALIRSGGPFRNVENLRYLEATKMLW